MVDPAPPVEVLHVVFVRCDSSRGAVEHPVSEHAVRTGRRRGRAGSADALGAATA